MYPVCLPVGLQGAVGCSLLCQPNEHLGWHHSSGADVYLDRFLISCYTCCIWSQAMWLLGCQTVAAIYAAKQAHPPFRNKPSVVQLQS